MPENYRAPRLTEPPGQPLARAALLRRKRRDAALVLPLTGVFLLASPVLDMFVSAGRVFGLPVGALYVFGVWFALIGAAAALAPRLAEDNGAG